MKIKYDNQSQKWDECINDKEKKLFSKNWLRKDTLDSWRHQRMLNPLKSFISKGDKWLTIGDGRYGTEANYLISLGVEAHASDLSDQLLEVSNEIGFINEYSQQNAEDLNFKDESFDFVLIKEALHHCPRPWLALNEAFRVCKKGVILIEPNDQLSSGFNLCKYLIILIKNLLKKEKNIDDYNFEEVGNFIYTLNLREIEKFMLAMHYRKIAYTKMNDYYIKGAEEVKLKKPTLKGLKIKILLNLVILFKDILCLLRLSQHSIICIALIKNLPNKSSLNTLKKHNWILKTLPKNPYIN